jgi:hypothetical protein
VEQAGLPNSGLRVVYQNGAAAILEKVVTPTTVLPPSQVARWEFGTTLRLNGYDLAQTTFHPGETIALTTTIESVRPPSATVYWRVELVDRNGNAVSKVAGDPFANRYPLQRWPPGMTARDVWTLPLDRSLAPGLYDLRMGLYRRSGGQEIEARLTDPATGQMTRGRESLPSARLAKIKIPVAEPSPEEMRAATALQTRVGDKILLSKYNLVYDATARAVHLVLYWECLTRPADDYTVFVHVLDSSGQVIAQVDSPPRDGNYPTSIWEPGEMVKDEYTLALPSNAAPPFSLEIGMYKYPSLERLPVGGDDHIRLDIGF